MLSSGSFLRKGKLSFDCARVLLRTMRSKWDGYPITFTDSPTTGESWIISKRRASLENGWNCAKPLDIRKCGNVFYIGIKCVIIKLYLYCIVWWKWSGKCIHMMEFYTCLPQHAFQWHVFLSSFQMVLNECVIEFQCQMWSSITCVLMLLQIWASPSSQY